MGMVDAREDDLVDLLQAMQEQYAAVAAETRRLVDGCRTGGHARDGPEEGRKAGRAGKTGKAGKTEAAATATEKKSHRQSDAEMTNVDNMHDDMKEKAKKKRDDRKDDRKDDQKDKTGLASTDGFLCRPCFETLLTLLHDSFALPARPQWYRQRDPREPREPQEKETRETQETKEQESLPAPFLAQLNQLLDDARHLRRDATLAHIEQLVTAQKQAWLLAWLQEAVDVKLALVQMQSTDAADTAATSPATSPVTPTAQIGLLSPHRQESASLLLQLSSRLRDLQAAAGSEGLGLTQILRDLLVAPAASAVTVAPFYPASSATGLPSPTTLSPTTSSTDGQQQQQQQRILHLLQEAKAAAAQLRETAAGAKRGAVLRDIVFSRGMPTPDNVPAARQLEQALLDGRASLVRALREVRAKSAGGGSGSGSGLGGSRRAIEKHRGRLAELRRAKAAYEVRMKPPEVPYFLRGSDDTRTCAHADGCGLPTNPQKSPFCMVCFLEVDYCVREDHTVWCSPACMAKTFAHHFATHHQCAAGDRCARTSSPGRISSIGSDKHYFCRECVLSFSIGTFYCSERCAARDFQHHRETVHLVNRQMRADDHDDRADLAYAAQEREAKKKEETRKAKGTERKEYTAADIGKHVLSLQEALASCQKKHPDWQLALTTVDIAVP